MRDAVIVEAVRTPVGRRNGGLSAVHSADLSAIVLAALVDRTGIDPALIDDVIWGCVTQSGEQSADIARTALLSAGWPESIPGVTIDRQCGSSQQAIHFGAAGVIAGQYDFVVAGGVEVMSRNPMGDNLRPSSDISTGDPFAGRGFRDRYQVTPNQGIGAEMIAARWGLSRLQLDEFALSSHEKAAAAQDSGAFDHEIVGVTTIPDCSPRTRGFAVGPRSRSWPGSRPCSRPTA
jgi:acetyl-CoA acyltransferase